MALTSTSCTKYIHDYTNLIVSDDKYDTEFPHRNCSNELEDINKSVVMVTCVGYYSEYHFDIDDRLTLKTMNLERARRTTNFNNTSTGTATVISNTNRRVAMLTCAHIVKTPEKIIRYHKKPNQDIVSSVAFLKRKMIYCSDLITEKIEVLVADDEIDVAILGAVSKREERLLPVFDYPVGRLSRMQWGSYVYLFGFPRGYRMISHGIVSLSKPQGNRHFYIDSPFNRGFSGGLVVAVKDGVPNFEFVGIATSAAAEFYNYLAPSPGDNFSQEDVSFDPYEGEIFSKRLELIMYGVTQVTSADAIVEFFDKNRDYLHLQGYYIDKFFDPDQSNQK
jgi:hypothetical protein